MSNEFEIIKFPFSSRDERGWVIRPIYNEKGDFTEVEGDEGLGDVKNLHIVSIKPGVTRGNHYHKHQLEFLLIMGGKVEVVWQYPGEQEKFRERIDTHEPVVLRVPNSVVHSVKNISDEVLYVVCYSKAPSFPGEDVFKVKGFSAEEL